MQQILGRRTRVLFSQESPQQRARLISRNAPFVLAFDATLCPWPKRPAALTLAQTAQLEDARALLRAVRQGELLAWLTIEGIVPIRDTPPGWLARRQHDAMVVAATG